MHKDKGHIYFNRTNSTFENLTEERLTELKAGFPDVDLEFELIKMREWLKSPTGRTRVGGYSFIVNWLKNCHPVTKKIAETEVYSDVLKNVLDEYLQGLWKNSNHILEMNTLKK